MQKQTLLTIVKATLTTLQKQNAIITPNNYAKEFTRQASTFRSKIPELKELDETIENVINAHNIKNKNIDTYYELTKELLSLNQTNKIINLDYFVSSLEEIISPSIDYKIESKIKTLVNKIKEKPTEMLELRTIEKLKTISKERIELDRQVIKDKTSDISKLTQLMAKYFDRSLIQSGNSLQEINKIKNELDDLELSSTSRRELLMLQNKLIDTVYELGHNLKSSQDELIENQSKFVKMQDHIEKLQKDLQIVKNQNNFDFLTGVLNRRAYDIEVEKLENQYAIFKNKYAVVFIDIDNFKVINDNHGHDCGDTILKTFAALLSALTREGDLIVRYGGEEFVSIIIYEDEEEVKKYAQRIKKIIEENNFVYKELKFKITFSAGVAYRERYDCYNTAVNKADDLMYKAKKSGREKIIFDDNFEI
ncbi:MAG: GGDEF domain-containing protein [Arcobacteraceae bacterium]